MNSLRRLRAFFGTLPGALVILALVLTVAGAIAFWRSDAGYSWRGSLRARQDIQGGHLIIYAHGNHPAWSSTYYRLFKERYGVIIDPGDSSFDLPPKEETRRRAYNAVSMAEVRRRFGADVFERTREDAKAQDFLEARQQHPASPTP